MKRHFIVLCEGYDDRDFWAGLLGHLGAENLFEVAGRSTTRLKGAIQPFAFQTGDYCFGNSHHDLITLRPCKAASALWDDARELASKHHIPAGIVINVDSDRLAGEDASSGRNERLYQLVQDLRGERPKGEPPYHLGNTKIDLVVWHCQDPSGTPGVPDKQTLERLVCAAIVEASISAEHPQGWSTSVLSFLQQEPRGGDKHKNYAHAYLAKYFAHERDDLFQAVWSRELFPGIADQLEKRLRATGAWRVAEALVNPAKDSL